MGEKSEKPRRARGAGLPVIGWREWVTLPELGIERIKCKVDTGARTSALHAFYLDRFRKGGKSFVRFGVHPLQRKRNIARECVAEIVEERMVADSGGHRTRRLVIVSPIVIAGECFPIEMTLTDRDTMMFRMLLGRTALSRRFAVDPARSYLTGRAKQPTLS